MQVASCAGAHCPGEVCRASCPGTPWGVAMRRTPAVGANSLVEAARAISAAATGMAGENLSEMLLDVRPSGVSR